MANYKTAWDWTQVKDERWMEPSEELIPIAKRWEKNKLKRILDLGCGTGRNSFYLARMGFEVEAMDLSASGVALLKKNAEQQNLMVKAFVGDMRSMPYEDNYLDAVVALYVIYHATKEELEKIICEIHRILQVNGEVFLTLVSVNDSSFKDPTNKIIAPNTIVKSNSIEADIPHYYTDEDTVRVLLREYELKRFFSMENLLDKDNKHCHYYILAKKRSVL